MTRPIITIPTLLEDFYVGHVIHLLEVTKKIGPG